MKDTDVRQLLSRIRRYEKEKGDKKKNIPYTKHLTSTAERELAAIMKSTPRTAPVPFNGQKKQWKTTLGHLFFRANYKYIIDVFGGSGFVSNIAKKVSPSTTVVFNDWDNYMGRVSKIKDTEVAVSWIKENFVYPEEVKETDRRAGVVRVLSEEDRNKVRAYLRRVRDILDIDYVTLSSFLSFQGNYVDNYEDLVNRSRYYIVMRKNRAQLQDWDWCKGCVIEKLHYEKLLIKYSDITEGYPKDTILWVFDPPYLDAVNESHYGAEIKTDTENRDIINKLCMFSKGRNFLMFNNSQSGVPTVLARLGIDHALLHTRPFTRGLGTEALWVSPMALKKAEIVCTEV